MQPLLGKFNGDKMRSQYGPEKILLASKKPHIQKLIKQVCDLTEEQIKQLSEKPDVIKGLLNIKKTQTNAEALIRAEKIADIMIAAQTKRNIG
jgi:REP element-mobilizing transposase RayT